MSKKQKKQQNAQMLDPNRFRIAQQNAVIPGGPHNNNPDPVIQSSAPPIQGRSIYNDMAQNYPQMGSAMLNPDMVPRSSLMQSMPPGRGGNQVPYGMQQQPDTSGVSMAPDGMESGRLAQEVQMRGVPAGPMGYQGMPAIPGGIPGNAPGTSGPPLMPGMPSAEMAPQNSMNPMTPGADKKVIKKKGK